jgi:predicted AAA+ superfamily ATPase
VLESLVETSIARDVLLLTRVDKPALLRQLFRVACDYSGRVLSYTKMLGQLQDAGNTTTLAHYLELLGGAGLVAGVPKFSGARIRQRASSPKLLVLNNALMSATSGRSYDEARRDPDLWGRLVESAAGSHLHGGSDELFYWREGNVEVDWVVRRGRDVVGLEIGSGRRKGSLPGLTAFEMRYETKRTLLVGAQGIPLEEFLLSPPGRWLD